MCDQRVNAFILCPLMFEIVTPGYQSCIPVGRFLVWLMVYIDADAHINISSTFVSLLTNICLLCMHKVDCRKA